MYTSFDWAAAARKKRRAIERVQARQLPGTLESSDSEDDGVESANSSEDEDGPEPAQPQRAPAPTVARLEDPTREFDPRITSPPAAASSSTLIPKTITPTEQITASSTISPFQTSSTNSIVQVSSTILPLQASDMASFAKTNAPKKLNPVAEHAVIAVTSVIGTVFLFLVVFLIYRQLTRNSAQSATSKKSYIEFDSPPKRNLISRWLSKLGDGTTRHWTDNFSNPWSSAASTVADSVYGYPNITGPVQGQVHNQRRVGIDIPPAAVLKKPTTATEPVGLGLNNSEIAEKDYSVHFDPLGQNRPTPRFSYESSVFGKTTYSSLQRELIIQRGSGLSQPHTPGGEARNSTATSAESAPHYLPLRGWVDRQVSRAGRRTQVRASWLPTVPSIPSRFSSSESSAMASSETDQGTAILEIVESAESLQSEPVSPRKSVAPVVLKRKDVDSSE